MTRDTINTLPDPNGFSPDPLTDLIRFGARKLIEQALEAELGALLAQFSNETTDEGHARIVRHGHLPEREVMTGVGPVAVKVPRVRDRGQQAETVRFTSSILPPYLRKAKSVEELLPWLYLKGISTGDFQEALAALLGPNAAGLSSTTISRLKADWWDDYERWQKRDLSVGRIVYVWADGVYFQPRMEEKQCVLVLIGADEWGRKEKLIKDREALLAVYDFPAEHWKHIRTTNPIESTFATVHHRTGKTKGCLNRKTGLAMAFKLMMSTQGKWRKLNGSNRMPEIIQGIAFVDGIKQIQTAT